MNPALYAFKDGGAWAICDIDADGTAAGEIRNKRWMPTWWRPDRRTGFRVQFPNGRYKESLYYDGQPATFATEWDAHRTTQYGDLAKIIYITADPTSGNEVILHG